MEVSRKEIWDRLSAVTDYPVKGEGELTYVNWMVAHRIMMGEYPMYTWAFLETPEGSQAFFYGNTAEVRCQMTICGHTNVTTLPVLDVDGKVITNPNSNDINTSKQRCRVKAMAEFGLFNDIYLPSNSPVADAIAAAEAEDTDVGTINEHWLHIKATVTAKNKTEAKKILTKFNTKMRNLGIEENDIDRKKREDDFLSSFQTTNQSAKK